MARMREIMAEWMRVFASLPEGLNHMTEVTGERKPDGLDREEAAAYLGVLAKRPSHVNAPMTQDELAARVARL